MFPCRRKVPSDLGVCACAAPSSSLSAARRQARALRLRHLDIALSRRVDGRRLPGMGPIDRSIDRSRSMSSSRSHGTDRSIDRSNDRSIAPALRPRARGAVERRRRTNLHEASIVSRHEANPPATHAPRIPHPPGFTTPPPPPRNRSHPRNGSRGSARGAALLVRWGDGRETVPEL